MSKADTILIAMNLTGKYHAKHWVNHDTKTRYAEWLGIVFKWNPDSELFDYCDYEYKENNNETR